MEQSGVVGHICSSPPAKSPHHMVLFMHSLFHIPAMWKKSPETHKLLSKWQQRKYNYRKHIHHQPCPEPTVACAACKPGWEDEAGVRFVLSTITTDIWSRSILNLLNDQYQSCHVLVSGFLTITVLGSTSVFWSLAWRWMLQEVMCKAAGLVRVWLWAAWQSF